MGKIRYEIDPHNRLVVTETIEKKTKTVKRLRKTKLSRFRRVLNGRFKIDKDNSVSYHVKAPMPHGLDIPHQVKLKGEWSLTEAHDLRFTLDKWGRQTFGDQLTLQGNIIDVNKNSLLFAITTRTKEDTQSTYILKLQGAWQADKHNRLTFRVKKQYGRHDILTFKGIWETNKNHQLIYRYEKAHLIRKSKKIHTLTFKGYWDIKDKARISYVIDKDSNSVFSFKTSLGIFKENYIKYELGIGLSHEPKPAKKTVTLFGKWKLFKNKGLLFEVEYENKKLHAISFGADAKLTDKDTVLLRLKNTLNQDIRATLKVSHKILKGDGKAFLRILKSRRESAIFAGAGLQWSAIKNLNSSH